MMSWPNSLLWTSFILLLLLVTISLQMEYAANFSRLGRAFVLLPLLPNSWTSALIIYKLSKGCMSHLLYCPFFFPPLELSQIGFHLLSFLEINQISGVTGHLAIAFHQRCLAEVSLHMVLTWTPLSLSGLRGEALACHISKSLAAEVIAVHLHKHSGLTGHSGLQIRIML